MKVVLFCGGFGTRLREYSQQVPKPLVPVGNRPILWNLMKYYATQGHKEFVLCLGYRGDLIKEFFLTYDDCLSTDFELAPGTGERRLLGPDIRDWRITFRDTGLASNIGQRLLAVREHVADDEFFMANYSDALTDMPLQPMFERLRRSDAVGIFAAVRPSNSLSKIELDPDGRVLEISYLSDSIYINGGFFIFRRSIFEYIEPGDELVEAPFERLIAEGRLLAYPYDGFWCAMDTFKDKKKFDDLFESGSRPWEIWHQNGGTR